MMANLTLKEMRSLADETVLEACYRLLFCCLWGRGNQHDQLRLKDWVKEARSRGFIFNPETALFERDQYMGVE